MGMESISQTAEEHSAILTEPGITGLHKRPYHDLDTIKGLQAEPHKSTVKRLVTAVMTYYKIFVFILAPLLLSPLPLVTKQPEALCGYMVLLCLVFWVTETLPLGVTALLPIVLCPAMGLLTTGQVASRYFDQTVLLFLGGLMVAIAIEASSLHRRLALNIIRLVGTKPHALMVGFMLPSWFLSMWITNTATCAMLLTFLEGIIHELKTQNKHGGSQLEVEENHDLLSHKGMEEIRTYEIAKPASDGQILSRQDEDPSVYQTGLASSHLKSQQHRELEIDNLAAALTLSICYASKAGGIACLTGAPTNIIMKKAADDLWMEKLGTESPVQFGAWMIYSIPMGVLMMLAVYVWLYIHFIGCRRKTNTTNSSAYDEAVFRILKKQHAALPALSWSEVVVSVLFALLVLLWFLRSPGFMPGWDNIFKQGFTSDAMPALVVAFILFIIPAEKPGSKTNSSNSRTILEWRFVSVKLPWDVLLLIGGGNALAHACNTSGLSDWLGERMSAMGDLPGPALVLVLTLCMSVFTEILSNMAACAIFMPIMINMSDQLGYHPLCLMFPVVMACQFAFMLPNSSGSSAVAFSYRRVTIPQMVKAGVFLNIFSVLIVLFANETWGKSFFKMNTLPWPSGTNNTTLANHLNL